ncbi:hypothetical protein D3C76_1679990 [compost metagenome]
MVQIPRLQRAPQDRHAAGEGERLLDRRLVGLPDNGIPFELQQIDALDAGHRLFIRAGQIQDILAIPADASGGLNAKQTA